MGPKEITHGFAGITALVVGDVMLDAYLWGRVERISPEAPVPVVHVDRRSARLGGAANVAVNMRALGARPVVVSVLGKDAHADDIQALFTAQGLATEGLLPLPGRTTTVKPRAAKAERPCPPMPWRAAVKL